MELIKFSRGKLYLSGMRMDKRIPNRILFLTDQDISHWTFLFTVFPIARLSYREGYHWESFAKQASGIPINDRPTRQYYDIGFNGNEADDEQLLDILQHWEPKSRRQAWLNRVLKLEKLLQKEKDRLVTLAAQN